MFMATSNPPQKGDVLRAGEYSPLPLNMYFDMYSIQKFILIHLYMHTRMCVMCRRQLKTIHNFHPFIQAVGTGKGNKAMCQGLISFHPHSNPVIFYKGLITKLRSEETKLVCLQSPNSLRCTMISGWVFLCSRGSRWELGLLVILEHV